MDRKKFYALIAAFAALNATCLSGAFGGYANTALWLIVIGFIMAGCMEKSGFSKRVALTLVNLAGGDAVRVYWAVALVMAIMTFLVPSITARTLLMLPTIGADPMAFALILGMNMVHQYLLPVTNMPNAVAIGSGHITSREMMRTGAVMSLLSACFMTVMALTYWNWLGLTR